MRDLPQQEVPHEIAQKANVLRKISEDSGKKSVLIGVRERVGMSLERANELAEEMVWDQIEGGLILMGLERGAPGRPDNSVHDVPNSPYQNA